MIIQNSPLRPAERGFAGQAKIKTQSLDNNNAPKPKSSHATSMEDLLRSAKSQFVNLKKGELIKGVITKLTPPEILIDIRAKTEAVVLEKDRQILKNLLSTLSVGETVEVSVLNPESDLGNPVVSLRRFLQNASWEKLAKLQKSQEALEVTVNEMTRGGYLVSTKEGMSGFLPNSHTSFLSRASSDNLLKEPGELVGRRIQVYVLELNKPTHKIIFSQKPVLGIKDFEQAIKTIKSGQTIEVTISNLTSFGVFVAVPVGSDTFVDGLIHISEVSWKDVSNLSEMFKVGQQVTCKVIGTDYEAKRLDLSLKRLTKDPFEKIAKEFAIDQKVTGRVAKVTAAGALVDLSVEKDGEGTVEGFIRKEKIPINATYEEGSVVTATVSQVDTKRHRIYLVPVLTEKPIGYR